LFNYSIGFQNIGPQTYRFPANIEERANNSLARDSNLMNENRSTFYINQMTSKGIYLI